MMAVINFKGQLIDETTVDFLRCKYGGDIIDRGIKVMHKDLFQSAAENRRTHVENPFKGVAL